MTGAPVRSTLDLRIEKPGSARHLGYSAKREPLEPDLARDKLRKQRNLRGKVWPFLGAPIAGASTIRASTSPEHLWDDGAPS
jgi:hypothetical protein